MSTKDRQEEINILSKDKKHNRRQTDKGQGHSFKHKESRREQARKQSQFYIDSFKQNKRLSSAWANDISANEHDDAVELYEQALLDDHKTKLSETYPKEYSKIYTYEIDFDDDDYMPPIVKRKPPSPKTKTKVVVQVPEERKPSESSASTSTVARVKQKATPESEPESHDDYEEPKEEVIASQADNFYEPKVEVIPTQTESFYETKEEDSPTETDEAIPTQTDDSYETKDATISCRTEGKSIFTSSSDECQSSLPHETSLVYHPPRERQLYGTLSCRYCKNDCASSPVQTSDISSMAKQSLQEGQQEWTDPHSSSPLFESEGLDLSSKTSVRHADSSRQYKVEVEPAPRHLTSPTMKVSQCRSSPVRSFLFGSGGEIPVDSNENEKLLPKGPLCSQTNGNRDSDDTYCKCDICDQKYSKIRQLNESPDTYKSQQLKSFDVKSHSKRQREFEHFQQNETCTLINYKEDPSCMEELGPLRSVLDNDLRQTTEYDRFYCPLCARSPKDIFFPTKSLKKCIQPFPDMAKYPQVSQPYCAACETSSPDSKLMRPLFSCAQEEQENTGPWRTLNYPKKECQVDAGSQWFETMEYEPKEDPCLKKQEETDNPFQEHIEGSYYARKRTKLQEAMDSKRYGKITCSFTQYAGNIKLMTNECKEGIMLRDFGVPNDECPVGRPTCSTRHFSSTNKDFRDNSVPRNYTTTNTCFKTFEKQEYNLKEDSSLTACECSQSKPGKENTYQRSLLFEPDCWHRQSDEGGCSNGETNDYLNYRGIDSKTQRDINEDKCQEVDTVYSIEHQENAFKEGTSSGRYVSMNEKFSEDSSNSKRRREKCKESRHKRNKQFGSDIDTARKSHKSAEGGPQVWDVDGCSRWKYGEADQYSNSNLYKHTSKKFKQCSEFSEFSWLGKPVQIFKCIFNARQETLSGGVSKIQTNSEINNLQINL
uniref:Uncharacterized protein n=1 Tax=Biomphalaria glabrata TaxID=6526 RepID=A0A2C9L2Z5_BIOGL